MPPNRFTCTMYTPSHTHLTITFFSSGLLFRLIVQFTHVLALYDPFGVDVPLKFDITYYTPSAKL